MALLDCVDRGLGIFTSDQQREVYWRNELLKKMEENGSTEKNILKDPEGFQRAIEDTFGLGAWAIERAITKDVRKQFDIESSESRNLVSAINAAGRKISGDQQGRSQVKNSSLTDVSQKQSPLYHIKAFAVLARSEYRVTMFVWALTTAYLLATDSETEPRAAWRTRCRMVFSVPRSLRFQCAHGR